MTDINYITSYQNMSGADRVATLLLALPDDRANDLLGRFSFDEIQQISRSMIKLEKISPSVVEKVLYEFMRTMYTVPPLKGSWERAEKLLSQILPEEKISSLRSKTRGEQTLWQDIAQLPVNFFVEHLRKESNQTIAIILKHIPVPSYVAKLLAALPPEVSVDVTYRLIHLPPVEYSVLRHLEQSLLPVVMATGEKDSYAEIAELIGNMTRSQEKIIMDGLNELHAPTVNRIRQFMFSFDEIAKLDNNGIQVLMKGFDKTRMAIALKGAEEEILARFTENMSVRAAKFLQDEMSALTVSNEEMEEAQVEMAQMAKQLIREGAIKRPTSASENSESAA